MVWWYPPQGKPNPSSTRKRPFQEAGRRWQERKLRVSGRASAAPENSAKVKGEQRRHRHVTGGMLMCFFLLGGWFGLAVVNIVL